MRYKKSRILIRLSGILLLVYALFLIKENPQPFGKLALATIIVFFLSSFLKNNYLRYTLVFASLFGALIFLTFGTRSLLLNIQNEALFNEETAVNFSELSFQAALRASQHSNKPVFVDFYTVWCKPCMVFQKEILADKETAEVMNKAFINLKYNIYKGEGKILKKRFDITYVPRVLILDHRGTILQDINTDSVITRERMLKIATNYLK